MRTFVYVDGFNLFYGALRRTPYRWLDLPQLLRRVLGERNEVIRVKYFTALVQGTSSDPGKPTRQHAYLRALTTYRPEVEIYRGHFLSHKVWARAVDPPEKGPAYVRVWKTEEKGSDVNLAVHLINDAWLDAYDCAVVVSNDSDLADAMKLVRQRGKAVGVITPVRPKTYDPDPKRRTSAQLKKHATFVRLIRESALRKSQLPSPIPGTAITKPDGW